MIDGLAAVVAARRRLVRALLVLLLLAFAVLGVRAFGVLPDGGVDASSGSARAAAVLDDQFGGQTDLVLVVRARSGSIDAAAAAQAGAALTRAVAAQPGVASVASYFTAHAAQLRSRDGTEALITLHVQGGDAAAARTVTELIARVSPGSGPLLVQAGGRLGQVGDALRHDFPGTDTAPVSVLVHNPTSTLLGYAQRLSRLPGVTGVNGPGASWADGRQTAYTDPDAMTSQWAYLTVAGPVDAHSAAAQALVRRIRATPPPAGSGVLVGGQAATLVDAERARLPYAVGWIAVTTLLLFFLLARTSELRADGPGPRAAVVGGLPGTGRTEPPRTRTITPEPLRAPVLSWPQVPYAYGRPGRRT